MPKVSATLSRLSGRETSRNENVEALRCALMFLIVAYHCFIYGPFSGSRALWSMCFTVLICWHTDGFMAISGWYGMRFRWEKVLRFVGQMAFYGVLSCLYCWATGTNCSCPWRYFLGGWFGSSYLALMFLAPVLNRLRAGWAAAALGAFFFISWVTGRFGAGMVPVKSFGVHAVLLMAYIYCVARWLRGRIGDGRPRLRMLVFGAAFFIAALPLFHLADIAHRRLCGEGIYGIGAYFAAFDAPHTVMMAFALLLLFVYYVRLPRWCGNLAVRLSPYLFGVYLCHATTSFGGEFYRLEGWLRDAFFSLHGFFAVLLTAGAVFAVGLAIEALRKVFVGMISGLWAYRLKR